MFSENTTVKMAVNAINKDKKCNKLSESFYLSCYKFTSHARIKQNDFHCFMNAAIIEAKNRRKSEKRKT